MRKIEASNLNHGLVGAWCPSVAGNGLLLPDLSGYGNHGTLTNMDASDWVGTNKGRALDFDGTNDQVVVAYRAVFNVTNSITVMCWVRTTLGVNQYAMTRNEASFYLGIGPTGTTANLASIYINNASSSWLQGTTTINDGGWHLIAATYNRLRIRIFADGKEENSVGATGAIATDTSSSVQIGARSAFSFFTGDIDDARMYNRALSSSEIKQLYEGGPGYGLKPERKRSRFQVQGFSAGRFRRQQLIGSGVY